MKGIGLAALIIPIILVAGITAYYVIQNNTPTAQTSTTPGTTISSTPTLTNSSTASANFTNIGSTTNSSSTTSSSQVCSVAVGTNSTNGLTLQTYVGSNVTIGDVMCIKTTIENDNQTTISSLSGSVTITNSQGQTVFEDSLVPFQAGSVTLAAGHQISFQYGWNTTYTYNGVTPQPGPYTMKVVVQFVGLQPTTYIESDVSFTLSA